ncbi:hypothetical protein JHK87_034105 [Glycine soja]|nr:hypothetical protein JHK87_034105 [Glycine soja]
MSQPGPLRIREFIELNAKQYPPPPGYQEPSMTRSPFSALTVAVPSPTTMAWKNIYVEAHLFFLVYNIPNDRSMMSNVSRFNNCNTIPIANKVLILTCVWIQFFKSTISQASFLLCLELLQRAKLQLYIKARQIADLN